jgi:hypothetical protein
MASDNDKRVTFEELVAEIRKDAPGHVTTVSYAGIKFARDAGIDCWYLAGSLAFQHVIYDHGTPRRTAATEGFEGGNIRGELGRTSTLAKLVICSWSHQESQRSRLADNRTRKGNGASPKVGR